MIVVVFCFFKQKTAYEMRISDWSSDVCSSDLFALSLIYLWFLPMVPLLLTGWLIWSKNISYGYWFATSQAIAWSLGTASYYALPATGPGFAYPRSEERRGGKACVSTGRSRWSPDP